MQNRKFRWSLVTFKRTLRSNPYRGGHFYHKRKDLKYKKWFYLTKNFDSAVSCTPRSRIFLTLSSNISAKSKPNSKMFYTVYQGPRWVRIIAKNRGRKSRDILPLTTLTPSTLFYFKKIIKRKEQSSKRVGFRIQ